MPDKYGVPDNVFGPVPEEFYALIGRVALLAAWVDDKVLTLLWALGTETQSVHAGRPTPDLMKRIKAHLDTYADDVRTDGLAVLERTERVLAQRHALLHSLWPNPTMEEARGWRSIHPRGRTTEEWVVWTTVNEASLSGTVADLVETALDLDRFGQRVHVARSGARVSNADTAE